MNKEEQLLEKRLIELSNLAFSRDIVTFSDFLNLKRGSKRMEVMS